MAGEVRTWKAVKNTQARWASASSSTSVVESMMPLLEKRARGKHSVVAQNGAPGRIKEQFGEGLGKIFEGFKQGLVVSSCLNS